MTNAAAIDYLESTEYHLHGWRHGLPYPLMELVQPFASDLNGEDVDEHDDALCDRCESLCTGDGFRWVPGLPELRFT